MTKSSQCFLRHLTYSQDAGCPPRESDSLIFNTCHNYSSFKYTIPPPRETKNYYIRNVEMEVHDAAYFYIFIYMKGTKFMDFIHMVLRTQYFPPYLSFPPSLLPYLLLPFLFCFLSFTMTFSNKIQWGTLGNVGIQASQINYFFSFLFLIIEYFIAVFIQVLSKWTGVGGCWHTGNGEYY